ncbi:MAG: hypothetical protein WBP84_10595, partial [Nitrososphaeraceae archaeon]
LTMSELLLALEFPNWLCTSEIVVPCANELETTIDVTDANNAKENTNQFFIIFLFRPLYMTRDI